MIKSKRRFHARNVTLKNAKRYTRMLLRTGFHFRCLLNDDVVRSSAFYDSDNPLIWR
jgi:hypothetical protein